MSIINLTQHAATPDQMAAGVVEPADKAGVQSLLTFEQAPDATDMNRRAGALADIAKASGAEAAMIGGAPYFMAPLEAALVVAGVRPLYSFTRREAVDEKQPDGSVRKTQVFRHAAWVEAARW
jgi:hypothetical protein